MTRVKLLAVFCAFGLLNLNGESTPDVAVQERQAKQAMLAGHYGEAAAIYRQMLAALPGEPSIRFNLGLALYSSGQYREALQQFESIRQAAARNPKFWFLLGMAYLNIHQPGKAIEPLEHAVALEPKNFDSRLELADALLESDRLIPAETAFLKLSDEYPNVPKIWEGLCLAELALSRKAFEELARSAPESSFRYGLAALAAAEGGNEKQAFELYNQALAAKPNALWMRRERSQLDASASGNPVADNCEYGTLACEFFRSEYRRVTAESEREATPEALYWRSRAYAELARERMQKLSALPPSAEQHQLLGHLYAQSGRKAEAIVELREAAKLDPGSILVQGQLAKALWTDRQYDQAIPMLERLIASSPENPDWQFELGDALFQTGKPEEAIPHLKAAVALSPQLLAAEARLGEVMLQTGRPADAIPHLERAQAIDTDGSIHFQLATAYRQVGKTDLAARAIAGQKAIRSAATAIPR